MFLFLISILPTPFRFLDERFRSLNTTIEMRNEEVVEVRRANCEDDSFDYRDGFPFPFSLVFFVNVFFVLF